MNRACIRFSLENIACRFFQFSKQESAMSKSLNPVPKDACGIPASSHSIRSYVIGWNTCYKNQASVKSLILVIFVLAHVVNMFPYVMQKWLWSVLPVIISFLKF
jgi:hypothetical protein